MNAINRTGIDRFLYAVRAVTILTNRPRAPEIGLHHKRVAGDMSAIPTSDADGLIDPDRPISEGSSQNRFTPCSGALFLGRNLEGNGGIQTVWGGWNQASQRVTTSSIDPS